MRLLGSGLGSRVAGLGGPFRYTGLGSGSGWILLLKKPQKRNIFFLIDGNMGMVVVDFFGGRGGGGGILKQLEVSWTAGTFLSALRRLPGAWSCQLPQQLSES